MAFLSPAGLLEWTNDMDSRISTTVAFTAVMMTVVWSSPFTFADESGEVLFENQIRPVLLEKCFGCHGGNKVSGGLRIDSREA